MGIPPATDGGVLRMWRSLDGDLPEPQWPDGVSVRTFAHGDAGAVKALLDEAYSAWDATYVPLAQAEWERWMTGDPEFDADLWFLAEREGDLVACALHWKPTDDGDGWVKDLAVREAERGRGLAKALLHQGFRAYAERGARRVGLKVASWNPTGALQLYERLGFVLDPTFDAAVEP